MKILSFVKYFLIFIIPLLIVLTVLDFAAFDESFYEEKFSQYDVDGKVDQPIALHQKVIEFIKGKSDNLPDIFNTREKEHLQDVRGVVKTLSFILYTSIFIFAILLAFAAINLKIKNKITSFFGKVLIYGGFLTIFLSLLLLIFVYTNFGAFFENFHQLFFAKGTYYFDSKDIIVNLYPEQIFMDIGAKISRNILIYSVLVVLLDYLLLFKLRKTE